jgi:HK97 family phage prohead protease
MDHLLFGTEWKAATAGNTGELEGYMSVFGNVDQGGDVVVPGAFKKTFADWSRAKTPMPLVADHELSTAGVIGSVTQMAEDGVGAKIRARFSSTQKAQDIRTNMVEGHYNGLSFTYEPLQHSMGTKDGRQVRYLKEVKVYEATVTPFPMNQLALASAKAADSSKPYGDVTYADPGYQDDGVKRYPLDSEAHCRAAWSYINMPKNAGKYTSEQVSLIKGRIRAALKKYGVTVSESSSLDLVTALNVAEKIFAIPLLSARKAALSDLAEYYLDDPAAELADEQPTADAAADTEEKTADGTADKASAYALSVIHPPEPRDDALDPLAVLRLAQDNAEADRLEAQILNARGGQ